MEDGWDDVGDIDVELEAETTKDHNASLLDDSNEEDDSFIPDSLRDFLEAADKKLENDLAGFLSPSRAQTNENDTSLDHKENVDDLQREMRQQEVTKEAEWEAKLREKLAQEQQKEQEEKATLQQEQEQQLREQEALERRRKLEEEERQKEAEKKHRNQQEELKRQQKFEEEERLRKEVEELERKQKLEEEEKWRTEQGELERQQKLEEEERIKKEQEAKEELERQQKLEEEKRRKEQEELERKQKLQEEERLRKENEAREELERQRKLEERLRQEKEDRRKAQDELERKQKLEEERQRKEQEEIDRKWQQMVKETKRRKEKERKEQEALERAERVRAAAEKEEQLSKELQERERQQKEKLENEQRQKQEALAASERQLAEEDEDDDECAQSPSHSALLDVIHPSANVTESHLKRIAMEGADDDDENDRSIPVCLPDMSLPIPSPIVDRSTVDANATNTNNLILTTTMTTNESGGAGDFSPSPTTTKIGRKLQMEFNREAHRASLDGETTGFERRLMLQEPEEDRNASGGAEQEIGEGGEAEADAPSNAAAAAATQAAAVVSVNNNDEGPITVPDISAKGSSEKIAASSGLMGRAMGFLQRRAQPVQKASSSPPRPKEIITNSNFVEDGGARSVSPLGGIQCEIEGTVSPLASPRILRSKPTQRTKRPTTSKVGERPMSTTNRRRQLTKPNNAFDRLSRPTSTSNKTREPTSKIQRTKINPEDEQRKARERIRKHMTMQRKKGAAKVAPLISPRVSTAPVLSMSAEKARKANAKREKMQRQEEKRIAKLKEKLKAKEERLQAKKKLEEEKKHRERVRKRTVTNKPQKEPEKAEIKPSRSSRSKQVLTVPVSPKFATDRRMGASASKPPVTRNAKERQSLACSGDMFGKGLRSSAPPPRSATPEPRRLTIPKAPTFATSQRHGEKTTPLTSPTKKRRDFGDDMSWSSTLRDVSGISPISKAASSVKTGNLTIPITPHFQHIRKRPLPKSTAEKEKEEMQYYKDHPFKAKEIKTKAPSVTKKRASPRRKVTNPEPFHFNQTSPRHHIHETTKKEENPTSFKAIPMPDFRSKKAPLAGKKSPTHRPPTSPEPFTFQSSKRHSHEKAKVGDDDKKKESNSFKAKPMPSFSKVDNGKKLKSPPTRPVTTPEPFHFCGHTSTVKRNHEKEEDKEMNTKFKARPMPKFASATGAKAKPRTTASHSKSIPTGAAGLTFRRSVTKRSEPAMETKTFKAKPMPNFIPDVIVTKTPLSGNKQELLHASPMSEGKNDATFHARPMPNFEKVSFPVKDKDPTKLRSPSLKSKESDSSTLSSFKANPLPKSLTKEPSIPVRQRDPSKLRSPDSVKRPEKVFPETQGLPSYPDFDAEHKKPSSKQDEVKKPAINGMEDAKARLRERLSKRKSNAATQKQASTSANAMTSPKAFSTKQVQSRLNSQVEANVKLAEKLRKLTSKNKAESTIASSTNVTDITPIKSNSTIPKAIDLPLKNPTAISQESHQLFAVKEVPVDTEEITPQISNHSRKVELSAVTLDGLRRKNGHDLTDHTSPSGEADKEAALEREAKLALANGIPDDDESSSILKLAQEVQRAAEDELSHYGSLDARDRMERELGF